ncbi:MAG: hydrolase [Sphingomonadales bacterium]
MENFAKEMAWIDTQEARMTQLVRTWSAVNSGSHNREGLAGMGEIVVQAFSPLGAELEVHETTPGSRINERGEVTPVPFGPVYHFRKRKGANRTVLLTGHLDTVFPRDHPFQTPVDLDANTLNGPGVADMKGGILVMLVALEALERSSVGKNLGYEILLSSDEEIGSEGSGPYLADRARHADFGMTYEPALADGTLAGKRKGSGNFSFVMRGIAAHAGREFEKGVNAISGLSELIGDLYSLNGQKQGLTINPGVISGGVATNVVPDLAILKFNVRVEDGAQQAWFEEKYAGILKKYQSKDGHTLESHGGFNRPPKVLTEANVKLFEILKGYGKSIGVDVTWKPTGGCCEGNNLAAAGLPNIDTLGVRGGNIHTAEEFALLDSFTERAKLSALLLLNYAAGNFTLPK